ncbi:MAG: sulfurtransferase-like selenium metabolism protein YedF [Deltaproteobacteria bacterium]|uniref:sulfurtransferase-like selenium metabolism protein YedF n=1 Tax=Desulfobacula sp. TaxID=2593537 RepID=UPI00199D6702|nr:sulfurtransferase-like selenium metabolism protein YedF [Candidatus Desulfobacula maris]MBL6993618.1 sulfurtransferase-like selenium metabolism protein YedF [Desulfobacula sp.]
MTKKIDARKLECPAPVLKTKKYLEQEDVTEIDVLVDNDAAAENVSRFLNFQGFEVSVTSDGATLIVSGQRDPEKAKTRQTISETVKTKDDHYTQKILVIISSQQIGKGDDTLGRKLMVNFVKTLKEMGPDLWRLVLLNHGVKFSTKDSQILEELKELKALGVVILVCGACLTHLGLMDDKVIGETTNMLDTVTSMQIADKVIHL